MRAALSSKIKEKSGHGRWKSEENLCSDIFSSGLKIAPQEIAKQILSDKLSHDIISMMLGARKLCVATPFSTR